MKYQVGDRVVVEDSSSNHGERGVVVFVDHDRRKYIVKLEKPNKGWNEGIYRNCWHVVEYNLAEDFPYCDLEMDA